MPVIELPNGHSAVIITRDDLTQRTARAINASWLKATSVAAQLAKAGWNADDPSTWGDAMTIISQDEFDTMSNFQTVLILNMVKSWTYGDINEDAILDLPQRTYEQLAAACSTEYNKVVDFSPDGVTDPLVRTPESNDSVAG